MNPSIPTPTAGAATDSAAAKPTVPFPLLGGQLQHVPIYVRPDVDFYQRRMGFLPDTIKLYLHVPWAAEFLFRLNNALMRDERNAIDEEMKYRLSAIVSRDNECVYCTSHHVGVFKQKFGYEEAEIERVLRHEEPRDAREALAREFVHQASLDSRGVTDDLRRRMIQTFTPQEYMEIVLLVGFWKMYNTMHNALGVEAEAPVGEFARFANIQPSASV
jgi:alkylhydroperoxidase family enzyme